LRLEIAKQSADLCSGTLDQRIVLETIRSGAVERRLPMLRRAYQEKRTVLETALRDEFGSAIEWPEPRGGFFLWARLGDAIDADTLLPLAIKGGVVFVPGSAFFVDSGESDRIRLSFSAATSEQIRTAVHRLARVVRGVRDAATVATDSTAPRDRAAP
jgi:2-aminoadipate transaminase